MEIEVKDNSACTTARLVSIDEFIEGRKKFRRAQQQALMDAHRNDPAPPPGIAQKLRSADPFSASDWAAEHLRKRDNTLARYAAHLGLTIMIPIERVENTSSNALFFFSPNGQFLATVDGFIPAINWVNAYGESLLIYESLNKSLIKHGHHSHRL